MTSAFSFSSFFLPPFLPSFLPSFLHPLSLSLSISLTHSLPFPHPAFRKEAQSEKRINGVGVWTRRSHAAMAATGLKRPLTSPARLPISANRSIRNSTLIQKPPVEIQSESRTGPAAHPRSCSATIQQQLTRKNMKKKINQYKLLFETRNISPLNTKQKWRKESRINPTG